MHCSLKKYRMLWLCRGLLQLLAAAAACAVLLIPLPAFAWGKINPFKRGGGARDCFDLLQ